VNDSQGFAQTGQGEEILPIGLQLCTIGDDVNRDPAATLKVVNFGEAQPA
jgi:hypothetical protein